MRTMLARKLDRPSYCMLLRNLCPIYQALEAGLSQWATHPCVTPIWTKGLSRVSALIADLTVLHGASWTTEIEMLPASKDYALRLQRQSTYQPELLVAHAYVRYLGDLSGGQLLRGIVARNLGLSDRCSVGLDFYDFGLPAEAMGSAQALRAGLNHVTQDVNCADAIVAEAVHAFGLHADLFQHLAIVCKLQQMNFSPHP
jgi:heme oxygenase